MNNKPSFDMQQLPAAYFCDNSKADNLRNQLIKNQVRINEEEIGLLEKIFFSDDNIILINKQIVLSVYDKTNIKIPFQSNSSLIIVMRYIFLEYARHLPFDISNQINELNCHVVSDILPNILTNVNQRIDYLKEINNPREILSLPINVNNGRRNLPSITNYF